MRHELWKSRKRKQRISNRREMRLTLCFLLHHSQRKIVSIAVEFGHTTRRRVVPREIASATAVMFAMRKCCTPKSRETRNSRKGKQSRGRGNPKEKKKPNVNRLKAECEERETLASSDDEYTFRLEVPASKVSAPFVSLKVDGDVCK